MKKTIFTSFALIFVSMIGFAQTISNASFENWTQYTVPGVGVGEYPTGWTTTDSITLANAGGNSATKGNDPFDGTYSLHLTSSQITYLGFPIKGPAIATNGIVQQVGASFIFNGGMADTARSKFFSGQYKYAPAGASDSALVSVFLLLRNGANRDTIAAGVMTLSSAASYTQFVVPLVYRDFVNRPDTCLILMQSSREGLNGATVAVGSELVVDSLNFFGFVGIDEMADQIKRFEVYPNPAQDYITIDAELKSAMKMSYAVYDANGRLAMEATLPTSKERIDISTLPSGSYILRLSGNGATISSRHFSVNR